MNPSSLNRWLGWPVAEGELSRCTAFASVCKESATHPRKKVVNAFTRRGARVYLTKGTNLWHYRNMPQREGWSAATPHDFSPVVEG